MRFQRVLRAIDEIRAGRMVILVDDEDRENEGDLTMAAERVTPEAINFMARHGRGLICLTLTEERIQRLQLPMMVAENRSSMGTAFTVSIEARHGVTTGISAQDRAVTIRTAVGRDARPEDLVSPGHVFPLKARRGGVLVRTGQTEGSVDLARLAGLEPAGVICEIMRDDGQMARMPDLEKFAEEHGVLLYVYPRGRTSLVASFEGHVLHSARGGEATGALRDFGLGAQVLAELGVRKIRLLSNNPKKIAGIAGYGIEVVERVPIESAPTTENVGWLRERREREGHLLTAVRKPGDH